MRGERRERSECDVHGVADVSEAHFVSVCERHGRRLEHKIAQGFLYSYWRFGAWLHGTPFTSWIADYPNCHLQELL